MKVKKKSKLEYFDLIMKIYAFARDFMAKNINPNQCKTG
jgi:hypothetical protein